MEVLDRADAPEVENVLAEAEVARTGSLAACDVREGVLDGGALPESVPAFRGCLDGAQMQEHPLVGMDRDGAAVTKGGPGATLAGRTDVAIVGVEAGTPEMNRSRALFRAPDRLLREVDGEGTLWEPVAVSW